MKNPLFALSFGLCGMILAAEHVNAQAGPCVDHGELVEQLARQYGETLQSIGLAANNSVVEIFASDSGSWTLTVTTAGGPTCLVAAGEAFQHMNEALPNFDPEA